MKKAAGKGRRDGYKAGKETRIAPIFTKSKEKSQPQINTVCKPESDTNKIA